MLTAKNVVCSYDAEPVVKGVSFTASANQNICILGPNGCGKTTLLKAIAGLMPCKGEILYDGKSISEIPRKQLSRKLAMMTQMTTLYFGYSVYETVMLGRYPHQQGGIFQTSSSEDKRIVLECMEQTGVVDLKDRMITELSGGQLQRVLLARVFAQDPELILLDEPTNHLDFKHQLELVSHLKEWSKQGGRSVIGVFHDINIALHFADSLMIMDKGNLVAFENAADFDLSRMNDVYGVDIRGYMLESLEKWR